MIVYNLTRDHTKLIKFFKAAIEGKLLGKVSTMSSFEKN